MSIRLSGTVRQLLPAAVDCLSSSDLSRVSSLDPFPSHGLRLLLGVAVRGQGLRHPRGAQRLRPHPLEQLPALARPRHLPLRHRSRFDELLIRFFVLLSTFLANSSPCLELGSVHGSEYGFGAHDFPTSGVFEVEPKTCPGFLYRCSILLGHTNMPPSEFRGFIERVASEYHGDTYHLISKNCNHFTDDVSKRLTARPIPQWVNRLAGLGITVLIPRLSLFQINFKVSPAEDGPESFSVITTTTHELQESDDPDQDKHLLSPSGGEVTIVKEVNR
ncbi:hypothetical protein ZIOFF_052697 [Zingiber officinale]|uniref:PPPDE domain-containing protein n=1 Tax=Zingiber officinale TaxID=94328 RepID=A0A8J5KUJ0_ZINOF|nr:hypothetical protein ZIOFF_052697 [Zingiber officinale]